MIIETEEENSDSFVNFCHPILEWMNGMFQKTGPVPVHEKETDLG